MKYAIIVRNQNKEIIFYHEDLTAIEADGNKLFWQEQGCSVSTFLYRR